MKKNILFSILTRLDNVSVLDVLFLILLVLKLFNLINISWFIVFLPIISYLIVSIIIVILIDKKVANTPNEMNMPFNAPPEFIEAVKQKQEEIFNTEDANK